MFISGCRLVPRYGGRNGPQGPTGNSIIAHNILKAKMLKNRIVEASTTVTENILEDVLEFKDNVNSEQEKPLLMIVLCNKVYTGMFFVLFKAQLSVIWR